MSWWAMIAGALLLAFIGRWARARTRSFRARTDVGALSDKWLAEQKSTSNDRLSP